MLDIIKLLKIMKDKNITPYQIAKKGEMSQSTISQIISGKRPTPSFETVCKIADVLQCDINELRKKECNHEI